MFGGRIMRKNTIRLSGLLLLLPLALHAQQGPLAAGQPKFLGCTYSAKQAQDFASYWNKLTPENAGK
jgi:endo-1,4-beta-xylanase